MARNPALDYFYEKTRSQIEHEDLLINHRLTWLFTLNGFLFTAYAFSLSAQATAMTKEGLVGWIVSSGHINYIRNWLAVAAISSSVVLWFGICAATFSMHALTKRCRDKIGKKENVDYPQVLGRKFLGMWGGLLPPLLLPMIFVYVWTNLQLYYQSNLTYDSFFNSRNIIIPILMAVMIFAVLVRIIANMSIRVFRFLTRSTTSSADSKRFFY